MSRLLTMLVVLLMTQLTIAQKMPDDYFDEGIRYHKEDKHKKAIKAFEYIVNHYPKYELTPRAFYNIGAIAFEIGNTKKAKHVFHTILKSNFNERENLGGGIMDDPYTNYRHHATTYLQLIHYDNQDYDSALYYLTLSDTLYPYLHFCGNAISAQEVRLALQYADLYVKIGDYNQAINSLSLCLFEDLSDNTEVIEMYAEIVQEHLDIPNIVNEFDEALKNIQSKTEDYEDYQYTSYWIEFQGANIPLPKRSFSIDPENPSSVIDQIHKTKFYQMLLEL